jgi:hypothetical protein
MSDATGVKQKKRGRPETGHVFVGIRFQPADFAKVEEWATANGITNRSEAIRALVRQALGNGG